VLTQTPGLDEHSPTFDPRGQAIVFVREDLLFRLDLGEERPRRLTGGFQRYRVPRFLPNGRLVFAWSEEKRHGLDVVDADGKNRVMLDGGTVYYRTLAPAPDGRFFAVTFAYDLGFRPLEALALRQREEVRLLDANGRPVATVAGAWRSANHSPTWIRE
jgi:tricorn protease-like protein